MTVAGSGRTGTPAIAPTLVERAIARVSPRWALARYGARVRLEAASHYFGGGYNGARVDRKQTASWRPSNTGPDTATVPDLPALRARAADLERNDPIALGAVQTNVASILGPGLTPHPRLDREFLELTDEEADAWERRAERIWTAVANSTQLDLTNRFTFAGLTYLALRGWLGRGDAFAIRRFVERKGDILGLKIQLVEGDRVTNPFGRANSPTLVDGVEMDQHGAPIRYHVAEEHPGEWIRNGFAAAFKTIPVPAIGGETGERQVLHVFRPERIGQTRGVPYLAPVIEPLKSLGRYSDAELQAAVIAAFFTVFVKTVAGDDTIGTPLDTTTAASQGISPQAVGTNDIALGHGSVVGLAEGESIEIADPKRPNANFDPFVRSFYSQIGVALELPHELLIKHFTSSYSASRGALIEAWRAFTARRSWLLASFCRPVYEWVIAEAVARGYLDAPGFFEDSLVRQAWCEAAWTGPTMGQLNPADEIAAAEKMVGLGIANRQELAAEIRGTDWDRVHLQLAKERRIRQRDGLDKEDVAERIVTEPVEPTAPDGGPAKRATPTAPGQKEPQDRDVDDAERDRETPERQEAA